jgi:outer membrane protein insertion porin family
VYAGFRVERNRFHDFDDAYIRANSYKNTYRQVTVDGDTVSATFVGRPYEGSVVSYNEEWNQANRLSLTVTRDSRNLPEFATRGSILSYTYAQTGGELGGFWSYRKHSFMAAKFVPLIWKFALAAKVQYGVISGPDGDDRILISDRYTPGGTAYDGIVRGYDDGSLTPDTLVRASDTIFFYSNPDDTIGVSPPDDTTTTGDFRTRVRGKFMFVTNVELQFPVVERSIYGLLFFDAGRSWLDRRDINLSELYKGWGIGFRIVVPGIGTIGFDFARPLDSPPFGGGTGWKPHFQIGTTFR